MIDSSSIQLLIPALAMVLLTLLELWTSTRASAGLCYKSIISFGDSLTDTGNLPRLYPSNHPPHCFLPPYGESFFHQPTGRASDGRLVIDFIAESFGLPFIPPYLAGEDARGRDFRQGVNFAVGGATALDISFLRERGVHNRVTNVSLGTQLRWFRDILPSLCSNSSDCRELLQSSLILMGEIGGNDYNNALLDGIKIDEVKSFVPAVVRMISSAIKEMIKLGAVTLVVPGNLPIGCSAAYLTYFQSSDQHDYDMATGCINWLNDFAKYHNTFLQKELSRIRALHPHATVIYADYYNAAMRLYRSPNKYGFKGGALNACCGVRGGPYNLDFSARCGDPPATSCDDPSLYVSWDGLHLTEAAYRLMARGLLQGPDSTPPINAICALASTSSALLLQD